MPYMRREPSRRTWVRIAQLRQHIAGNSHCAAESKFVLLYIYRSAMSWSTIFLNHEHVLLHGIVKQQERCPTQQLFAPVVNPIVSTQVTSGRLICTSVDSSSVARVAIQTHTYARKKQFSASTYSYVNKDAAPTV
jgi:hypothetical protein